MADPCVTHTLPYLSLVNVLSANQFSQDVVPTVAFNLRQVRKGNVTLKIWDVAVRLPTSFFAKSGLTGGKADVAGLMVNGGRASRVNRSLGICGIGMRGGRMRLFM